MGHPAANASFNISESSDSTFASSKSAKSSLRTNTKVDLSKKSVVHYQKKISIYVQKSSIGSDDKENQQKNTLEMDQKTVNSTSGAVKAESYKNMLPH